MLDSINPSNSDQKVGVNIVVHSNGHVAGGGTGDTFWKSIPFDRFR